MGCESLLSLSTINPRTVLIVAGEPSQDSSQGLGLLEVLADDQLVAQPDRRQHQLRQEVLRRIRRQQPRRGALPRDQVSFGKSSIRLFPQSRQVRHRDRVPG